MKGLPSRPIAVLYKGHSAFESLNTMVDHWAAALGRAGFRPTIVDVRRPDAVARTVHLIRTDEVALFLSLNGYGVPADGHGPGFYGESTAPLVMVFVDNPLYHPQTIRCEVPRAVVTFPTPHQISLCRDHIRADLPIFHIPHAAEPGRGVPWRDRDIPVLIAGSAHDDPERARAGWAAYGPAVRARLEDILAAHTVAPRRPLHEVALETLGHDRPSTDLLRSYFCVVDHYLRSAARVDFVRAASGLPLTLVGHGWDTLVPSRASHHALGPRPAAAVFDLMARSKLVLNVLPPYYESHERPFQAMAHGAAAAAVAAPWFLEAVGVDAVWPLPPGPNAAASAVAMALADDDRLAAIAARGAASLREAHTWDHRLKRLLDQDTAAISSRRAAPASGR